VIPQHDLTGARQAHQRLSAGLDALRDEDARRPSRLEGWSVGHVLTHIARNAEAITGMFVAANQGRVADQYAGGLDQRAADIEAGADRSADELVADVRATAAALERVWADTTDLAWATGEGRTVRGVMSLPAIVFRRWREVEVHHADLGLRFGWADWSDAYVDLELDQMANGLAARLPDDLSVRLDPTDAIGCWIVETVPQERVVLAAPRHELLAWLLGRHDRPDWPTLGPATY
jgi:maleylpyruvate isomerase